MIRVAREQQAHQPHVCADCDGAIREGDPYLRVVQFLSWTDIGLVEPNDPTWSEAAMFKIVARQPNTVILKTHVEGQCQPT